jgi:hypothetical protein
LGQGWGKWSFPTAFSGEARTDANVMGERRMKLEAASGFEPENRGFADLRLNHLATPPRCGITI